MLQILKKGIGQKVVNIGKKAVSIGEKVVNVETQSKELNDRVNAEIKHFNETEEGRQELYQQFRDKYGVNDNPIYNTMLRRVMTNLTRGVAVVDPLIRNKPYLYFISAQSSINAACSMGHVMMINAGTFEKINNEDEIAAIVGHEMGHGQKNHVAGGNRMRIQKAVLASLAKVAVGETIGNNLITSAVLSVTLNHAVAHGDRMHEMEADSLSFDYMINTNYNPGACAAIMQKYVDMEKGQKTPAIFKFFVPSDHPDSDKRRDAYVKRLEEYSGKHVTAKDAVITVNGETLTTVAAADNMSAAERSYLVLGNLATAYHKGQNKQAVNIQKGVVMLGNQPIIAPAAGDESAYVIAERLNAIK